MKKILQKWRGLTAGALLAATTLATAQVPQVKTLGGGPNQTSSARAGSADGDTFAFAKFKKPYAAALDSEGNLFIADFGNGKIRKVTKVGAADSLTSTFVSGLASPSGVAIGVSNVVYVVTQGDGKLRKFSSSGALLETVGGFRAPTAVALSTNGTVFLTELSGNIYQILPNDSPMLVASGFRRPHGIAVLNSGLLAVTESSGHAVQLVDPNTGVSTLLAGGNGAGFADGSVAKFNQPYGIALAPNGSLVVADRLNHRVRIISSSNQVSTLYGVSKSEWVPPFPGWVDGPGGENGTAAAREPVGVVVSPNSTVYVTETYWNLLRQVTSSGLVGNPFGTNTGIATNIVDQGTNKIVVVGTNIVSLGFASGEASSDFIGAAGQHFYVPTTLTVAPGQKAYTFQMSLSATGETGVVLDPAGSGFVSMLVQPGTKPDSYFPIPQNYEFLNSSINLLGVGWLERYTATNLYDTLKHHLIQYSIAKDTLFQSGAGKTVLGGYRVSIPATATPGDTFLVALRNASGTADGVSQPLALRTPTDGPLGAGEINSIKRITLASRLYLVGDSAPFRWYNAGEFGNGTLANNDVIELFQTAVYGLNFLSELNDSDLFNAMDSSDGARNFYTFNSQCPVGDPLCDGNDTTINSIMFGDGVLNVDDVWVTFRRSLDPTLKWFGRYWSNGALQVVEVPNTLASGFSGSAAASSSSKSAAKSVSVRPRASLTAGDRLANPFDTLEVPVQLDVTLGYAARVMMLNVTVEALDGSPQITTPIQFQTAPVFQNPEISDSHGPNNYSAAWLNNQISGMSGSSLFAILTMQVPGNAGARAAYRIHFNHFSASPNGVALFDAHTTSGLILLSDRSASTWNDGISDAWRLRYFGSIYAPESAPGADADGDGVVNSVESQNGTDPTDATSF